MDGPLTYQHRAKPYAPGSHLEMKDDHIAVEQGTRTGQIAYADINLVRLLYKPRNMTNQGFLTQIYRNGRKTLDVSNLSWRSLIDLERQDKAYAEFVQALVRRIAAENPAVILEAGMPRWLHSVTAGAGILAILSLIVVGAQAIQQAGWPMMLLTIGIGLYFCWWTATYLTRNRPRRFSADAIPPDVMPSLSLTGYRELV